MNWGYNSAYRALSVTVVALALTISAKAEPNQKPAYESQGDTVDETYNAYTKRLKEDFETLRAQLSKTAPKLLKKLKGTPPKPVPYGYQILPKIMPDSPIEKQKRATSVSYSWPRTESMIKSEIPKLEEFEEKLGALKKLEKKDQVALLEAMVADYPKLEENQKLLDSHVQYNRFWQKAIAQDKLRFDNQTRLHDMVLERQELLDELEQKPDAQKQQKADQMLRLIQGETIDKIQVPTYLKMQGSGPNRELHIKLYTDITDTKFLKKVIQVIEDRWVFKNEQLHYQLKLNLVRLQIPGAKKGEHINPYTHVNAFPKDGAILTTGSNTTFAIPGKFVVLGPQPIAENVVAHEFGHLLGFLDGYLRGYRNRGDQGFEVLEVIPDSSDILCMPASGKVQKRHFEKIFESLSSQSTSKN